MQLFYKGDHGNCGGVIISNHGNCGGVITSNHGNCGGVIMYCLYVVNSDI